VSFLSYTNPVFLSLIHFLLLVYIFPIFHCVISFLHEPCLPQLDPFPSISVHISYLPVSFLSYTNPVFLSLIHFLLFVYIFPIFHSVISFLHEPCISQLDPFPSINVHISYLPQCHFFPSYTNPVFLSLIHFLLLVYIFPIFQCHFFPSYTNPVFLRFNNFLLLVYVFPIFHSVISFLHEPCLPQLDPFPSISVHISYLPQCHFFPTQTLSSSA
jgi:hypothetical protein